MNRAAHGRSNQASTSELHTEGEAVRFEIVAGKRGNARCRANQTKNGDDFAYANEEPVRRLLQVPFEQQPNMDPEREWFIAGRSMPDTEPVSLLKLRRPSWQVFRTGITRDRAGGRSRKSTS
jgi:hypothetical protein